jgi:excisionase family DNA binding protein
MTRPVCFACSRASHRVNVETATTRVAFDVATRMNIKGGTDKPTPNQTLPFRERLGCSPNQACVALGVGRTFLYRLIAEHRIEVSKLGRRTIVNIPSLLKLLDEQAAEPKPRRPGRPRKTDGLVAS